MSSKYLIQKYCTENGIKWYNRGDYKQIDKYVKREDDSLYCYYKSKNF